MSIQLIHQYQAKVDQIIRYSGTRNESSLRAPFQELIGQYARAHNLLLVLEVGVMGTRGRTVYPDGTLKDALRQNWGFWESKDEKDVLTDEIAAKFAKGYPNFNILFEDTHTAILWQSGYEVLQANFNDALSLDALLTRFVSYEPQEVAEFHKAIELFSAEVGGLAEVLRRIIEEQFISNPSFQVALTEFLELCKKSINPKIEMADVREMVIQHVLTEDIFMRVFDEAEFHRENVIAHKLGQVVGTFYTGDTKRNILARIKPYYETINARAAQISDHHEKQKFLKALYESFYKAYNPKAADRLGIVYTPDEIVRFMIASTDHLTYQHFGKCLGDIGVEILDPATGTGTFITELIEYLPPNQLAAKYENEIHCNEVAILPYYIANLNIEYTFKQKAGEYKEFENICFVDTLDNVDFVYTGKQLNFLGLTDENSERIARQNSRPIMVVIGNPPYNANQANENENNKNREYKEVDNRIRATYAKYSTASTNIKLYDMYARFYRWASDRLNKTGMIAFITNNSFLDSRTFDGFRKAVANEFSHIYIVDLGGNIRKNPKLSGPTHNVFAIQTGVCIAFMVKTDKKDKSPAQIFYTRRPELELAADKLEFLRSTKFSDIRFDHIQPDKKYNWLNITHNDWDDLIPVASKETKAGDDTRAIFKLFSLGVNTNRDEWIYDFSKETLISKMKFFLETYNADVDKLYRHVTESTVDAAVNTEIKWSSSLKQHLLGGKKYDFQNEKIMLGFYRPYIKNWFYFGDGVIHRAGSNPEIIPDSKTQNLMIAINMGGKTFGALASNCLVDLHFNGDSQCLPLYRYAAGERVENITDWALGQFQKHYKNKKITKTDIFHYVYAVLHHPAYRVKYEQNLKRDFPRLPFYADFAQWAAWGARLMDLHLNYEQVPAYPLERIDLQPEETRKAYAARLLARKATGVIEIDTLTILRGVPPEVWAYQLGTYSALEWILERYKEKRPKDPTISEKFNTYKFADYKESVIELLGKVCRVSVETMKIIGEMPE